MNKKDEIILATIKLFSEKGYSVTISDIGKEVSLKPSSIYSHFENKNQIIFEAFKHEIHLFYDSFFSELEKSNKNKAEESLKFIHSFYYNYYKDMTKFKFLNHIYLIPDLNFRNQCINLRLDKDRELLKNLKEIFSNGVQNNEIKKENVEENINLYITSLIGNLYISLLYENKIEELFKKNWAAIWDTIKI